MQTPYAILYRSLASRPMGDLGLRALAVRSAQRNARAGITGLLLHGTHSHLPGVPGAFVQWLEGPREEVEALLTRIEADDRHRDLEVLASSERLAGQAGRLFPAWDLGVESMGELPATLEGFLGYVRRQEQSGAWSLAA